MDATNPVAALPQVQQDFVVPTGNVEDLRARIEKLNKRAAKNGLHPITMTVGAEYVVEKDDPKVQGNKLHFHVCPVHIEGETPRVNGWDFIATLQHLGEDGNVIRAVPGFEGHLPVAYRTARPDCDHCGTFRARKDTYVLRNAESGEFKQVGSNCLADFLRTTTPQQIAEMAELLSLAMDAAGDASEGGDGGFGGGSRAINFVQFMSWVISAVRVDGAFTSKTKARIAEENGDYANAHSTVSTVQNLMFGDSESARQARREYAFTPEEAAKAVEVIAWAREQLPLMVAEQPENDYLYNLSVAIKRDYLNDRLLGIAGSLIAVWNRDLVKKALAKANRETLGGSKHFGQVGERIKFLGVTLLHTFRHDGNYGTTYITKLLTDSGNVAVWFASAPLSRAVPHTMTAEDVARYARYGVAGTGAKEGDIVYQETALVEYGERVVINGTVKKHDERDGIKQTILSRCTVWTPEGIEEEQAKQARRAAREAKKAAKAAQTKMEAA